MSSSEQTGPDLRVPSPWPSVGWTLGSLVMPCLHREESLGTRGLGRAGPQGWTGRLSTKITCCDSLKVILCTVRP